jgi:serine/threonine protein phosphatase PrpC
VLTIGALSDIGCKRTRNEDVLVADPGLGLFLVVDGMGGHGHGDLAAQIIGETIREALSDTNGLDSASALSGDASDQATRIEAAILAAQRELVSRIDRDEALVGMGGTMVGALVSGTRVVVANVGDCRGYLVRDGRIEQLTVDHSWVGEQVRAGKIGPDEAKTHPMRNVVTSAITAAPEPVDVGIHELSLNAGARLLLCCDGLHGVVSDEELLREVQAHFGEPQAACRTLIELARSRGAPDNVTVIIVGAGSNGEEGCAA